MAKRIYKPKKHHFSDKDLLPMWKINAIKVKQSGKLPAPRSTGHSKLDLFVTQQGGLVSLPSLRNLVQPASTFEYFDIEKYTYFMKRHHIVYLVLRRLINERYNIVLNKQDALDMEIGAIVLAQFAESNALTFNQIQDVYSEYDSELLLRRCANEELFADKYRNLLQKVCTTTEPVQQSGDILDSPCEAMDDLTWLLCLRHMRFVKTLSPLSDYEVVCKALLVECLRSLFKADEDGESWRLFNVAMLELSSCSLAFIDGEIEYYESLAIDHTELFHVPTDVVRQGGIISGDKNFMPELNLNVKGLDDAVNRSESTARNILTELQATISSLNSKPLKIEHTMNNPFQNFNILNFLKEHKIIIAIVILCYIGANAIYVGGSYESIFNVLCALGATYVLTDSFLFEWIMKLKDWVSSMISRRTDVEPQGGAEFIQSALPDIAMLGLLGCMFKNLKSTTMTGLVEEFFTKNSNMRRVGDGMKFTLDYFLTLLQKAANMFSDLTGLSKIKIASDPFWEITVFEQMINEKKKEYITDPHKDSTFVADLLQLKAHGEELRSRTSKLPNNHAQMNTISLLMKEINDLMVDLNRKLVSVNGLRQEPLMVLLMGPAGVGKTTCMNSLWPEITAETLDPTRLDHFQTHMGEYLHTLNQSDDYYSGYNGQVNMVVDEFAFKKDIPGAASVLADLVLWINVNPMNLNMADLNSKGRTYFRSKYVWATSNRTHFRDIESVVEKEAIYRRLYFTYIAAVKPEYSTDETSAGGPWERRLDKSKLEGLDTDNNFTHLQFYRVDNIREGHWINLPIEYDDLKMRILAEISDKKRNELDLTNLIKNKVDKIIARRVQKQAGDTCPGCPSCKSTLFMRDGENIYDFLLRAKLLEGTQIIGLDEQYDRALIMKHWYFVLQHLGPMKKGLEYYPHTNCAVGQENLHDYLYHIWYNSEINRRKNKFQYAKNILWKGIKFATGLAFGFGITHMIIKACSWILNGIFGVKSSNDDEVNPEHGDYPQRKAPKMKNKSQKAMHKIMVQGGEDPNAHNIITKLVNRNLWRFNVKTGEKSNYQGCVLVLQNNLVLMPEHYLRRWMDLVNGDPDENIAPQPDLEITFTNCTFRNNQTGERKMHSFTRTLSDILNCYDEDGMRSAQFICASENVEDDVGVLFIPGITGKTIKHLFRSKDQKLPTQHKGILGLLNRDYSAVYHSANYYLRENIQYSDGTWSCSKGLVYDISTRTGDCGSPFVIFDKAHEAKIASIHVGGIGNTQGVGVVLERERIEAAVLRACQMYDLMEDTALDVVHDDVKPLIVPEYIVTQGGPVYEARAKAIPMKRTTDIIPSPINGKIEGRPPKEKPAMLGFTNGIDPMVNAMWGYGVSNKRPRLDLFRAAIDDYCYELYNTNYVITKEMRRPLTFEEAVMGLPGEDFLDGVNRKTSPGWPMKHLLHEGSKQSAFGLTDFTFDSNDASLVRKHVDHMEKIIISGKRPYVLNNHFLKDETRTIEKANLGKTRLISSADFVFSILLRKYTLMFSSFVMRSRIDNGTAVGVNAYSNEWNHLAHRHGSNAKNYRVIAGDFSHYDKDLAPEDIWALKTVMVLFYCDANKTSFKVRNALIDEIAQSRHLVGSLVYGWMGANTSGNPLTVIINSISGCILDRYGILINYPTRIKDYQEAFTTLERMRDFIKITRYGDDGLLSVQTNGPFNFITQKFMTESFAKIDMIYTDERKSSEVLDDDRCLDECTFLKRNFSNTYYKNPRRFIGALSLDSILESIQWSKTKDVAWEHWHDNMHKMLMELSAHPKEVWAHWQSKIIDALVKSDSNFTVGMMSYHDLQDKFVAYEEIY